MTQTSTFLSAAEQWYHFLMPWHIMNRVILYIIVYVAWRRGKTYLRTSSAAMTWIPVISPLVNLSSICIRFLRELLYSQSVFCMYSHCKNDVCCSPTKENKQICSPQFFNNPCDPLTLYTCTSTFSKVITWKYCSSSITGIVQTESESKKKTIFQTSSFDYIKPTKTYKDARNLRFNRSFLQMNKFTPNLIHNRD